jgi:chaperone BCS1
MMISPMPNDESLSNEQLKNLNNPFNNVQQLGYDSEKYLFVTLTPRDKEFKKLYLYTIKRIDNWREERHDGTHFQQLDHDRLGFSLKESFKGATVIVHHCIGNVLERMGVISMPLMVILVERETAQASPLAVVRQFVEEICQRFDSQLDEEKRIMIFDPSSGPPREILGRNLSTVYLPAEQKRDIIAKIESFLSEDTFKFYYQHGIPHKMVYLLYGLPGTGKTSLVKALATHFNMTIMPLKISAMDDMMLRSVTSHVPKDTIILLEDFDSAFTGMKDMATRNVEHNPFQGTRLSFSAILDLLDGISSPERQIIFITCNNTDIINSPYMRAGRIDHVVQFGPMTGETAREMLTSFFSGGDLEKIAEIGSKVAGKLTPAELQTLILESKEFGPFQHKIEGKLTEIKSRYASLNQQNQKMYENYYKGLYQGFNSGNMYT